MRPARIVSSSVLCLALFACANEPALPADETGDGDGDPGDGDLGDGDGDSGDGDGDPSCSCDDPGPFDECREATSYAIPTTLTWPEGGGIEPSLDETCTVTAVARGASVELDCPSGIVGLSVDVDGWAPGFTAGAQLRLRASESPGMAEGSSWPHLRWRLDREADGQLLIAVDNGALSGFLGDPFAATVVADVCAATCGLEAKQEPVALELEADGEVVRLFGGEDAQLGDHQVYVGIAERYTCTDGNPGSYAAAAVDRAEAENACALVLDRGYASVEPALELCNWTVSFDGEGLVWSFSDVGDSGSYRCEGLDLYRDAGVEPFGSVSADGTTLTWDGVLYTVQ